jgi:hypothetical protein
VQNRGESWQIKPDQGESSLDQTAQGSPSNQIKPDQGKKRPLQINNLQALKQSNAVKKQTCEW